MATVTMKQLLESGVHFGHQTRRWNPKMKRYIFGERGGIYIIDLQQTIVLLQEAMDVVRDIAERGGTVLFVGTKKQCQDAIQEHADRAGMPFVSHRWLGGLLTNWGTISQRIRRLHELRNQKREGQLDLLPTRERLAREGELAKLETNLGGVADMQRLPDAVVIVDLKKEAIGVREANRLGPGGDRPGGHQLRPRRGDLRHPRQRRRDPLLQPDRRVAGGRDPRGQGHPADLRDPLGGPGGGRRRRRAGRRGARAAPRRRRARAEAPPPAPAAEEAPPAPAVEEPPPAAAEPAPAPEATEATETTPAEPAAQAAPARDGEDAA